jgi:hypothetical protein
VVALTVKEDVWVYGIAASIILLHYISVKHAAVYLVTSVAYYVLVLHFLYPILYPNAIDYFLQLWAYGSSKGAVRQYLVTHPCCAKYNGTFNRAFGQYRQLMQAQSGRKPPKK